MASPSGPSAEEASPIEVDPDLKTDDHAADGEESIKSSATSLSSSILDYRKLNGRTYHNFKDAEYWAPNDEVQNDGLDLHNHMMYLVHDNALHLAPIKDPKMVLDVGTGTGLWATDFADQYPSAQVIGTDLSPIQPSWVPPNCTFLLEDATIQPWTFSPATFDFIHLRFLLGSVPDWPALYAQALRCLKPGGWLEHSDFTIRLSCDDGSVSIGDSDDPDAKCVYTTWNKFFKLAGEKTGRTFNVTEGDQHIAAMKIAGFEADKIFTRNFKLPLGTWPADKRWKEIGAFNQASCEQGLEGYALYLGTEVLGWSREEMRGLFGRMREAMRNKGWHVYYPCATTWAQRAAG